jgi:hypothetical protein
MSTRIIPPGAEHVKHWRNVSYAIPNLSEGATTTSQPHTHMAQCLATVDLLTEIAERAELQVSFWRNVAEMARIELAAQRGER